MSNHQIDIETTDRIEDLRYEPVSQTYRSVQIAYAVIAYVMLIAVALLLLIADTRIWCIAAETVIIAAFIVNLIILRKAYQHKGYALREHDITYRSGVIFPKITTVPLSRIQQVSISQNPISRLFNLYAINIENGAQWSSSLDIQGLTKEKAEGIKNVITNRLNNNHD